MSQASSPGRCCWPLFLIRCGGPSATRTRIAACACDQLHHFIAAGVWDATPVETELLVDARGAPQWAPLAHPLDEFAQLTAHSGPPWPTARAPAPIGPKPCAMPAQDRVRLNDAGQTEQAWPEPGH